MSGKGRNENEYIEYKDGIGNDESEGMMVKNDR